jgi:O-antigen/teichoic acid export membrane protein
MGEATESLQSALLFEDLSRWRWWAGKGSLAVLDQGLISGSNFLITILLARWLTAGQYGAYTLAFSIFLLLGSVHDSLVSEPMTVFGPSSYADHRREYVGAVLKIEAVLGLIFVAVLGLSAVIAHYLAAPSGFAGALAGLTVSAPCVFLLWLTRFALYVEQSPGSAALGGLLYSALVLSGTLLIFRRGLLSPFTAFLVIALGAAAAAVFMLVRLKPVLKRESNPALRRVWNQHWRYGRWVLGTAAVRWIPGNVLFALTGSLLGMAEVGGLRALLNLSLPVTQAANSLSNLAQPYIAGIYGKRGRAATRMPVRLVTLLYFGGGSLYWVLLTVFRIPFLRLLYGGKFLEHASLVPWVTLGGLLSVCAYASMIGLKAIQSPSSVFAAYTASSIVALTLGVVATWAFGLPGAIGSYVLSIATFLVVTTYSFRRKASISPAVPDDH